MIGGMQITKKYRKTDEQDDIDYDVQKDTAGVKVVRFDEDIQRIFCSRNTGSFGYITIVGNTKLSLYLAYAEEIVAVYDHVWTLTQMDLKRNLVGSKIQLLDFTANCDEFITYSQTGEIVSWAIGEKKFVRQITKLGRFEHPLTMMKVVGKNKTVVCYSRIHSRFLVIFQKESGGPPDIMKINTDTIMGEEPYGECSDFQVDNSNQFLIAIFPHTSKIAIIDLNNGQLVRKIQQDNLSL